jgi:hypothetical protein
MHGKTRDGIKLSTIVRMVRELDDVSTRMGTNHPILLLAQGYRPCPVAESSDARRMISPWLSHVLDYSPRQVYSAFRAGRWYRG